MPSIAAILIFNYNSNTLIKANLALAAKHGREGTHWSSSLVDFYGLLEEAPILAEYGATPN